MLFLTCNYTEGRQGKARQGKARTAHCIVKVTKGKGDLGKGVSCYSVKFSE